jgi:type III secretory pathway component EscR
MATRAADKDLENGIKVALDAADTASGVTEEFNNVREQFEVVNIQAKRIYQSVLIIFISAIVAAVISLGAGMLMYYKALGTLRTNSNMAIESLAIFTENVSSLDKSVQTVETNTKNQEVIKNTLEDIRSAAEKASTDIAAAENKYNQAIKLSVQDTERVIKKFAETTLEELKMQSAMSQDSLSEKINEIQKFFTPDVEDETGEVEPGDNIVTYKQFQALESKVDQVIVLQKELAANMMEMNRIRQVEAQRKKAAAPKIVAKKPPVNPLKFP